MGGRGRGRATSSFTQEQLQTLGCVGKDLQTIDRTLAPPPLFPMLSTKPVALDNSSERQYKVLWKEDFISYLRDSPYFTKMKTPEQKVQRYSDAYVNVVENTSKIRQKGEFYWDTMPAELRPSAKRLRRDQAATVAKKKAKTVDVVEKLIKLEKMENETEKTKIKEEPGSDNENAEDEVENEEYDEEMDDENDYGNNYFDNGEAFNDDDDNLDDGPVY